MRNSHSKFNNLRNLSSQAQHSKGNKISPMAARGFILKRINTDSNEKYVNTRRYLLKKGNKSKDIIYSSISKENFNPHRASDFVQRISFNDFQHDHHRQTQDFSQLIKKSTVKKNNYISKVYELQSLTRKKDQRKTNQTQISISSLGKKERTKIITQPNQPFVLKQFRKNTSKGKIQKNVQTKQEKYKTINNSIIGAGTFGKVYVAINNQTGEKFAIKKVFNDKNYKSRQIDLMQKVDSPFVVKLIDKYTTVQSNQFQQKQYTNIIMPKYESSLFDFLKPIKYRVTPQMLKIYLYQIFRGIFHLHSRNICHRDLKPQNILIKNNRLVICDLGSAKILRKQESNISYICSRCYRAPQLIFGATNYTVSIDIWSAGCIILQILNKNPFFIAKDSLHHLIQVMKVMGTPTKKQIMSMNPNYDITNYDLPIIKKVEWSDIFTNADPQLLDLISKIMTYNPNSRLTAEKILKHTYFDQIREQRFLRQFVSQVDTKNFFIFDQQQIILMSKPYILVPKWYLQ